MRSPPATTLSGFLETIYLPARPGLRPNTVEQYQIAVRLLDRWHGRPVTLVEAAQEGFLAAWFASMTKAGLGEPATANSKRGAVLTLLRAAWRQRFVGDLPRDLPPPMKEPRKLPDAWRADQVRRAGGLLWGAVKDYWKQVLLKIGAKCQCFYFTSHLRQVWQGSTPTGRLLFSKAKTTETEMHRTEELTGVFDWEKHVFQPDDPEQRTLIGTLENGTVVKGRAARGALECGLAYRFLGHWTTHPKFGRQFHFSSFAPAMPAGERATVKYCRATTTSPVGRQLEIRDSDEDWPVLSDN